MSASLDKKWEPILKQVFYKADPSGYKRKYGIFECPVCRIDFESRTERLNVMTGLCRKCVDKEYGKARRTHGLNNRNSRLHTTWANMKRRCLNPVGKENGIYQGVSLCEYWKDFSVFMEWALNNGYSDDKTIDRIDPQKGYEPNNCRFVDYSVQAANRKITSKNKTGYIGIYKRKNRWQAKIQWRGKQIHIGLYRTKQEAADARDRYIKKNNLPHTLTRGQSNQGFIQKTQGVETG